MMLDKLNEVGFSNFNPKKDIRLLKKTVHCYREVFAEEPWDEWKLCSVCGKKWGINQLKEVSGINFRHCGKQLIDFWPTEIVTRDIVDEINPESTSWLALNTNCEGQDSQTVIGFCWGYPISPKDLAEKTKLPELSSIIANKYPGVNLVGYQDEIGLVKKFRNLKIGKEMHRRRLEDFRQKGLSIVVSRTKTKPPTVTYHWYRNLGYEIIAEYNDKDGRVMLAAPLDKIDL